MEQTQENEPEMEVQYKLVQGGGVEYVVCWECEAVIDNPGLTHRHKIVCDRCYCKSWEGGDPER